ncbi:SGNH/GDSL hydrolase family protein [Sphingomonas sp. MMS24-J13]|uniref:SGNH/GDSL hydrolase family protein n=1 Tax=Sphingomonas sp. MMS24-J13 TaxID=3238686 RepID=UPI0038510C35
MVRGIALALTTTALVMATPAEAKWITSWSAAPVNPIAAFGPFPATPSYNNRTFRQTLRLSAGGAAFRLRISNAYGAEPLEIGAARVALLDDAGKEVAGSSRIVRFAGSAKALVEKGALLVSDTVALPVAPLARLSVSLYLPGDTGPCTCHQTAMEEMDISAPGDHSAAPFVAESKSANRIGLAAVEVDAPKGAQTVVVLGDSISDGVGSTSGKNRRWPDFLAERLAKRGGTPWGVANQGISGNRVLQDGLGVSALARFDRDVIAMPGVSAMILFEGINDINLAFGTSAGPLGAAKGLLPMRKISADDMIAAYRQIIVRAHAQGIRVFGATIAPYKGLATWSAEGEAARQKVNAFIRTGGAFDAVLDFDKVFADPADPAAIRANYHMGDHLHGNDASYKAVAESIDLSLFGK